MEASKFMVYDKSVKIAEYDFDQYDVDTMTNAEHLAIERANKYFKDTHAEEVSIVKSFGDGTCTINYIKNDLPNYKTAHVFMVSNKEKEIYNTISVFDDISMAKSKMCDYFAYKHDEFEKDEISEIVDELISSNEYQIDGYDYYFKSVIVNKC